MEFRWVAVIVVWTLLAGPVFNTSVPQRTPRAQEATKTARVMPGTAQR